MNCDLDMVYKKEMYWECCRVPNLLIEIFNLQYYKFLFPKSQPPIPIKGPQSQSDCLFTMLLLLTTVVIIKGITWHECWPMMSCCSGPGTILIGTDRDRVHKCTQKIRVRNYIQISMFYVKAFSTYESFCTSHLPSPSPVLKLITSGCKVTGREEWTIKGGLYCISHRMIYVWIQYFLGWIHLFCFRKIAPFMII